MSAGDASGPRRDGGPEDIDGLAAQPAPVSNWNIANALTVARIVMVPVFGWLLLYDAGQSPAWRWTALVVFVVAMATDRLDGQLARSRGLITDFGKLADPIADKALTGMAFIGLSLIGHLWWWVTIVVLAREIGITLLRFVVVRYGVMPASRGGKLKTVLQAVALGMLIAPIGGFWPVLAGVVMAVAVIVTLVTGADYVLQARRLAAGARSS
ncbi:CDP-diacylglycerol--glycerol-3-phosphate 3-phosphatidyltransferase [Kineosphaera limosa]|uniref:CDP-diacylglycerol--glycerol-3-phosphate 3-phosphatidyltransferase n=1 Tax=Kineosphaera limosa NBRC 100340 TaxID=1184609 RepID=K6WKF9_9MICO|nr:CDP-diacylglycerol--glycerol-3-phosphate 3-phosphatidyltransferase [Kineosphaera limosa]NYE02846.1 CDP-diacylglycerol--glycerol-3-phosphate 3-phosphatidyltransferase [Kineosphaera limosa]GAB94276.1 phosphatidylglycerophosphate synthase [Kineosphaera limosa NBRC 100340]